MLCSGRPARRRPTRSVLPALLAVSALLTACGEGPSDPAYDVVGVWEASFTQPGQVYQSGKLVFATIAYDMTLTFGADNRFLMEFVFAALGDTRLARPEEGIYFTQGDRITITNFAQEPSRMYVSGRTGTFRLEADRLILEGIFQGPVPPFARVVD